MREILEETITMGEDKKVHESGRTICGKTDDASIQGPLARFPTSVELAQCPRGVTGGTWHTHVTKSELQNPNNSLPDTANVIFGNIDVSAVVGTQSVEMVMAADDKEAAKDSFRNVLGADVDSTGDVVDAIISQEISDPGSVRERMRREMPNLFERRQTNFTDLDAKVKESSIPAHSSIGFEMHEAMYYSTLAHGHGRHGKAVKLKNSIKESKPNVLSKILRAIR